MPEWSNLSFNDVMTGLWFAVFGVLGWIGSRVGVRKPTAPPPSSVEVAGALIDTKRVDVLIDGLGLNTVALTKKSMSLEKNSEALDAHRGVIERVMKQTDAAAEHLEHLNRELRDSREAYRALTEANRHLREEIRDLRDEMLRGGRGRN